MNSAVVKPAFIGYAAVTQDEPPLIARNSYELVNWTSPEDKQQLRAGMRGADVLIIGSNTYTASQDVLAPYRCIVFKETEQQIHRINGNAVCFNPGNTPERLVPYCQEQGYCRVAVLGGSHVYAWFVKHELLDEFYITIEPVTFGDGIPLLHGDVSLEDHMSLQERRHLNGNGAWLEIYVKAKQYARIA